MSEPVSNSDVEDVLASIRRLVTHEDRPAAPGHADAPQSDPPQPDDTAAPGGENRLVLTPSLRVAEPDGSTDPAAEAVEAGTATRAAEPSERDDDDAAAGDLDSFEFSGVTAFLRGARQQDAPETTEAAEAAEPMQEATTSAHPAEPDTTDEAAMAEDVAQDVVEGARSPDVMNLAEYKLTDAETETPQVTAEVDDLTGEEARSDMEDAPVTVGPDMRDALAFGSVRTEALEEPAEADMAKAESDAPGADMPATTDTAVAGETDAPADDQAQDASQSAASVLSLGQKIAALEDVINRREENWEPDGSEDTSGGETELQAAAQPIFHRHAPAPPAADAAPAKPEAEVDADADVADASKDGDQDDSAFDALVAETAAGAVAQQAAADLSDTDILDEEALRDMVAEIVRQELQGELGERITRNVRKLVRREIHRALTAQELE